jgi:hypothetical protein
VPLLQVSPAGQGDDKATFLAEFRALRDRAALEYEELAARAHYPSDVLKDAESGPGLPGLPVLAAYVRACGGDVTDWEERWRHLASLADNDAGLPVRPAGASPAAVAGARAGVTVAPAESHDAERIRAALRAHREREEHTELGSPELSAQPVGQPVGQRTATILANGNHHAPPAPTSVAMTPAHAPAAAEDRRPDPPAAQVAAASAAPASATAAPAPTAPAPTAWATAASANPTSVNPVSAWTKATSGSATTATPAPGPKQSRRATTAPANRPGLLALVVVAVLIGCVLLLALT